MADALISVAVERTAAIIEEQIRSELKLLIGVEDEVKVLSGKLGTIRTVLDDADKRAVKEQSVKQWLKKLEDAAYEMEDILDEWHYALVNHKTESQNETVCCSFILSPLSCLCFKNLGVGRSICLCFKNLGVRHTVGIKIQDVKAKLDKILIEKDQFNFVTSLPPSDVEPKPSRVQSMSSIDQAKVHGLDIHKNKNEIVRRLMDDSNVELLSIVGMGGLGKTTLAQLVFNDTQVKDHFDLTIWICVSDPFDVAKIAREIVESVTKVIIPPNTSQLELVLLKLRDSISGKKFFLVLDDVWTETHQEWEPLKINLSHGAVGSKILVTSRKSRVAKMMGSSDHQIYNPQHLSDEECWSLLRSIALHERSEEECREFEGVGMKIADKCKGLPLAANVLGRLLQFKNSLGEWENVWKSEIWQLEEAEVDLFPHLLLSYNELSPALKCCFSYCAIYPKDSDIDVEIMIKLWMALGYLGSVTGKNGGVEVKGRDYFNNLAMRSLFQDIERKGDGSIESCKMHDIVHDFALFLRKNDDNLLPKSSCQVCSPLLVCQVQEYRSLVLDKELPKNVCDCLASVRVLIFAQQSLSLNGLPQGMKKLIHLRWLHLSGNDLSEEDLKIICRLYFLQTLLLSNCSLKNIPREIGNLVELRHLDLSGNGDLEGLPAEIGNLVELRHLDISRNGELKELPSEIGNLVELRHLDLSGNGDLEVLPAEIGNLVELRHLDLSGNWDLEVLPAEIGNLVELRHLELSFIEELKELPSEIGNLVELRHLDLSFVKKLKELPESVCSLVELRILNLNGCKNLQLLPERIHKLRNLQQLSIKETPASRCLPRGLAELSGLNSLKTTFYGGSGHNNLGLLKKLNSLTGSLDLEIKVTSNNTSDVEELVKDVQEADLRSKIHIHTLSIKFKMDKVKQPLSLLWMEVMEALEPNLQKLNKLNIWRYMGSRLPEWISSPHSLVKDITLYGCHELSSLPPFGKLPSLEFLTINNMKELKCLGRELLGIDSPSPSSSSTTTTKEVVAFPKLKGLHISYGEVLSEWEDITAEEEESAAVSVMPCLQELVITSCDSLKKLPHRLLRKASSSLRILEIEDSRLLESQYGDEEGSEWRSISQYNPQLRLKTDIDAAESDG